MNVLNYGRRSKTWVSAAALALAVSACASNKTEARDASATPAAAQPASADASLADRETTVQISKAVRERCRLQTEQQPAPRFEFDQSILRAPGRNVLDDVANCLTDGPLNGEEITLVGRADARGSAEYNESLAASRAAAARNYLAQRGVAMDRMHLLSRGEQGATGSDEASYAVDRRVDLELGNLKSSPILEGSMMQAETSRERAPVQSAAASYADTAEGGKPVSSPGSASSTSSTTASGSASGSVNAGASSK